MFIICPVSGSPVHHSQWYDELDYAKEEALDLSAELNGESVLVYEAKVVDGSYQFNKLFEIFA